MANALQEEMIWRGVVMTALDSAFGAGLFSLLTQAAIFGMAHFIGGFPGGWIGAGLAGLYGLGMGLLRRFSNGLLIPWIAHSAADFVVISLIVRFAQHA
jgi:membrane protease YdiL (CAAX protease family)